MMRFAWIILLFAGIGAGAVQLRVEQNRTRTELQRLDADRLRVRRELWEQQRRLGELTAPQQVRLRGRELALELTGPEDVLDAVKQTVQRK